MNLLLFGADDVVLDYMRHVIPDARISNGSTIGVVRDGELIAGVAYSNFDGENIEASIASTNPRWCSKRILKVIFAYPFKQLGCRRMTARTMKSNKKARALLERLGFKVEGVLRKAHKGKDVIIYGLLKEEQRYG